MRSPVDAAEYFDRLNRRQPTNQVELTSPDLHCLQPSECLKVPSVQSFLYCGVRGMPIAGQATV